jgi:hypothetical protein
MNILKCLLKIYPDWSGAVWDNSYEGIKPNELETRPTPTLAELEAVWPEVEAELKLEEIQRSRAEAYPPLGEFADAYYWAQNGDSSKMEEYVLKCAEVKNRFPKP